MDVRLRQIEIAEEGVGHGRVVVLARMNDQRRKLSFAPLHCFDNWRDLHEVWPRAYNVDYFEHSAKSNVQSPMSNVRLRILTLNLGLWTLDLQPDYPRAAVASDVSIERVPGIDYQRTKLANAFVVCRAVIGDNY